MTEGLKITPSATIDQGEVSQITELVHLAEARDGFSALNEAALLHLRHPRSGVRHILARQRGELVGYAQLDSTTSASIGQLVVGPQWRQSGIGSALLVTLISLSSSPLRIWAMGNSVAARALAASHGLLPARELLIMTRSLTDPVAEPAPPADIVIRPFVVGQDEGAWLTVNARAFRHHPEQGRLTRSDLEDRLAEAWFDPAGFFVATRADQMIGFHWTKQHPERLGEVYVLGVDPGAGGQGLGKALLVRGLEYLQQRGNVVVELYVESDHSQAISLYRGYGFTVASRDVMYAQPRPEASKRSAPGERNHGQGQHLQEN
ncbi:MAG: mycothiol synthase [Propionibacteriaceae bacterium]|nr:mycothiol synthase [Propionibacteriaceae bacterium]